MSDVIEQLENDWDGFMEFLQKRPSLSQGTVVAELERQTESAAPAPKDPA
jgi:hypothetical protein